MANGLNLRTVLSLDSKAFKRGISNVKKQVEGFKSFLKGAFALGSITAFGKQMVQVGADFENAMAKVQAVSNAPTKEFQAMQKEAQRLGESTKYTATEAANALENLTRNGMTATQATQALAGVLQLAQANAIELANAADILTNTMNAFGLSVSDTQRINDVLSTTAANAATNINELYEAIVVAGPYSKIMGKSLEETASAIGVLANNGIKGSGAGKALAAMYQRLSAITPKAQKALDKYNISIDEEIVKTQSLSKTLKQLAQSGIGNSVEALSEIFGKNYAGDIAQLINSVDAFDAMLEKTGNSAGTTARMFEQGVGSVRKELDTLKSTYEGFLITLSQKTGGVIKGAIRLLQNLINNFKSVGGTIMNIASVAVPLLATSFTKLMRSAKIAFGVIKAGAITTQVAIGNIVTVVATLVTWVGTSLVGAWNRSHQAMKDATKSMAEAEGESVKLKTATKNLLDELQPEKDKKTLAGIVNELTGLFPEFADAIKNAADEAGKTGKWENFKKLLTDIADLQSNVLSKNANQQMKEAVGATIGEHLKNQGQVRRNVGVQTSTFGAVQPKTYYSDSISSVINRAIENMFPENTKQYKDVIWNNIGKLIASSSGDRGEMGRLITEYLKGWGIDLSKEKFEINGQYGKKYVSASNMFNIGIDGIDPLNLTKQDNDLLEQLKRSDANIKSIDQKIGQLTGSTLNTGNTIITETEPTINPATETDNTTDLAKLTKQIQEYKKQTEELGNQHKNNALTDEEYVDALTDLENSTWKTISAFSDLDGLIKQLPDDLRGLAYDIDNQAYNNRQIQQADKKAELNKGLQKYDVPKMLSRDTTLDFTKTKNEIAEEEVKVKFEYADDLKKLIDDLQKGIDTGDFTLVKDEALNKLKDLKTELENVKKAAVNAQQKITLSEQIVEINKQIEDLDKTVIRTCSDLAEASDRILRGFMSIAEVFDEDIRDSELYKSIEKFTLMLNAGIQLIEGFKNITEIFKARQEKKDLEELVGLIGKITGMTGGDKDNNENNTDMLGTVIGLITSALSGGLSVGPILKIIKSVLGFADGGIVGGNSFVGDKQLARVNSGEMILNKAQQASLFNAIQSGNLGSGGNVNFKIRGTDLIGVINNYNKKIHG